MKKWRVRGHLSRRSVFFTLLLSFAVILLFPVGIGTLLYEKVERSMVENANRSNLGLLEQLKMEMDNRLREVDRLAVQISLDPKLASLINIVDVSRADNLYPFIDFMYELNALRTSSSFHDDFYIAFQKSGQILSPSRLSDTDTFYRQLLGSTDPAFNSTLKEESTRFHLKFFLPSQPLTNGSQINHYITFIQSLPIGEKNDIKASLVIFINDEQIRNAIQQFKWLNQGQIYILGEQRQLIMTTAQQPLSVEMLSAQLAAPSGYDSQTLQGKNTMLANTTSSENGWTYVSVVPKQIVMAKVDEVKVLAFWLLCICLVGGTAICLFLTVRNYVPIRDIVEAILQDQRLARPEVSNELDFIKHTMVNSFQEEKELRNTLSKQVPVIQANFLVRLIRGYVDHSSLSEEPLAFMGIRFLTDHFSIILIDIYKADTEREWALVQTIIANLVTDFAVRGGYTVELEHRRLAVLLSVSPSANPLQREMEVVRTFIHELMKTLEDRFRIFTSMAVSHIHRLEAEEFGRAYREALTAVDYRIIKGMNTAIFYEDIQVVSHIKYSYPIELETQILNCAKIGDYASIVKLLDHIYDTNFQVHSVTPEMGKCLFIDLLGTMLKLQYSAVDNSDFAGGEDLVLAILACTTAEEMLEKLKEGYAAICERAGEGRTQNQDKLFNNITEYIEAHYNDCNFNVSTMADHLQLTPQYLSTFFKKHSGQNLTDYVALVRVAQTKQLLAKSSLTISQIARQVGYANDVGLIRVFKKTEGITPGKYREITMQSGNVTTG